MPDMPTGALVRLYRVQRRMSTVSLARNSAKRRTAALNILCRGFTYGPGSADEPHVIVRIKTEGYPVKRQSDESGDWIILEPWCYTHVTTQIERTYPTSFDWLHAELKNDDDARYRLSVHDEWTRLDDRRKRESESD